MLRPLNATFAVNVLNLLSRLNNRTPPQYRLGQYICGVNHGSACPGDIFLFDDNLLQTL
jgi:hypothetical protein